MTNKTEIPLGTTASVRTMAYNDGQGCPSAAGAGSTGAADAGRLYQLIEAGVLKAEYIYNDMGQRTKKTLYQSDGITVDTTTIYHYDRRGMLITETTETGTLIKDYIWQEGMMPVAQIDNNGGTESINYLYTDHLMTNRLATSQSKTIIWRWEGEAFGNTPAQELGTVSVNLRFPGQYYDAETNLHYNWHRYYDPTLGRYITSDPIRLDGGMNTYSYANVNPIRFIDPLGLRVCLGTWHQVGWERIFNFICQCVWLYIPCGGTFAWSGNSHSPFLPRTRGKVIFDAGARGRTFDPKSGNDCLCEKPGSEESCVVPTTDSSDSEAPTPDVCEK